MTTTTEHQTETGAADPGDSETYIPVVYCGMSACRTDAPKCAICTACGLCEPCQNGQACKSLTRKCETMRLLGKHIPTLARPRSECEPCPNHEDTCAKWCAKIGTCWRANFDAFREKMRAAEEAAREASRRVYDNYTPDDTEQCVFCYEEEAIGHAIHQTDGDAMPIGSDCLYNWNAKHDSDEFNIPDELLEYICPAAA